VLAVDVNGGMREAETKTINIEDVDGDIDGETVMRFIEYAYTGDYTVPEPEVLQLPTDTKFVVEAFTRAPVSGADVGEGDKLLKRRKAKKNLWYNDIVPEAEAYAEVVEPDPLPEASQYQRYVHASIQPVNCKYSQLGSTYTICIVVMC